MWRCDAKRCRSEQAGPLPEAELSAIAELEEALGKRGEIKGPYVVVIDTDPYPSTEYGGTWWEVGVPEVSMRAEVNAARAAFETNKKTQRAD